MAIISLQEAVDFLGVPISGSFQITAVNDVMVFTSSEGGPVNVELDDGTYEPAELATELTTQMNADNALTGTGTITFVVTYNTSTYKFTIDATVGNTIAYTDTGSDAGVTLGFDSDKAAAQTITSDNAVTGGAPDIIDTLRLAVIAWVESYTDRTFESTAYTHELYDGGGVYLWLKNYPVTIIKQISLGRVGAIRIKNTDTAATNATATVDSSGINLELTASAGDDSSTVGFSTYATMTAAVAQIVAVGNGWTAELVSSDYGDLNSSELLEAFGRYCGSRANRTASWIDLDMPSEPIADFTLNSSNGELYRVYGWPSGNKNIPISHTSGYSAALMPDDLKTSLLIAVQVLYSQKDTAGFNIVEFEQGNYRVKYGQHLPETVTTTWDFYQRLVI